MNKDVISIKANIAFTALTIHSPKFTQRPACQLLEDMSMILGIFHSPIQLLYGAITILCLNPFKKVGRFLIACIPIFTGDFFPMRGTKVSFQANKIFVNLTEFKSCWHKIPLEFQDNAPAMPSIKPPGHVPSALY